MDNFDKELSQKYCYRFGKIAVDRGYVDREKLKEAIMEQIEDDLNELPHKMLGMIFFEKGWMTSEQIDDVLKELFRIKRELENSTDK